MKRKITSTERKILERDLETLKERKDFVIDMFIHDCESLNKSIGEVKEIIRTGEIEDNE